MNRQTPQLSEILNPENEGRANAFAAYSDALHLLCRDEVLAKWLNRVAGDRGWWPVNQPWERTFARFDPWKSPFATLVYQAPRLPQGVALVEIYPHEPEVVHEVQCAFPVEKLGWVRVSRFPFDARLPTLAAFTRRHPEWQLVRYRPHKRCTFRLQQYGKPIYAKVFPNELGKDLYLHSLQLWHRAKEARLLFRVARPLEWAPETLTFYQAAIPGRPVYEQLLRTGGETIAFKIGQALASLSQSGLSPTAVLDLAAQMQRTQRNARKILRRMPELQQEVEQFLQRLQQHQACLEARPLRPIHGSPHAHQWLQCRDGLGLVDFDRVSMGHPELDLATFLAEMDYENDPGVPVQEINAAVVAGYVAQNGTLDPALLKVYRAHKRFAKVFKAAKELQPQAGLRVRRNLRFSLDCLNEKPDIL